MMFAGLTVASSNEASTIAALAVIALGLVGCVLYLFWEVTRERVLHVLEEREQQLLLAKVLYWWNYDMQQGDGMNDDYIGLFTEACALLDITVTSGPPTDLHPDGTFKASPSLAAWLASRGYSVSKRYKP